MKYVIFAHINSQFVQDVISLSLLTQESHNERKIVSETSLPIINVATQSSEC